MCLASWLVETLCLTSTLYQRAEHRVFGAGQPYQTPEGMAVRVIATKSQPEVQLLRAGGQPRGLSGPPWNRWVWPGPRGSKLQSSGSLPHGLSFFGQQESQSRNVGCLNYFFNLRKGQGKYKRAEATFSNCLPKSPLYPMPSKCKYFLNRTMLLK